MLSQKGLTVTLIKRNRAVCYWSSLPISNEYLEISEIIAYVYLKIRK